MRKKISLILCAVFVIALTMGVLVGCTNDKPDANTDPIIGTWIGQSKEGNITRYFYMEIEKIKEDFKVKAKEVYKTGNSKVLTEETIYKNTKENQYGYNGNFSPLPHATDEKLEYHYRFLINGSNIIDVTERSFTNHDKLTGRTLAFERTTLTLEEYQLQVKAAQETAQE